MVPEMLTAFLTCPQCGADFEGVWPVEGDVSDLDGAPVAGQTCPQGHVSEHEYPGWSFMTEAG
jgi:hypothetical protein